MKTVDVPARVQLKNILFPTDLSPAANSAVAYAAELARHYGAKLHALHVRPPVINLMTPPESWEGLEEAAELEAKQQKRKLLGMFAEIEPDVLIKEGDLWSNLAATIEGENIDLIVMGTRGRSGIRKFLLGSVAEEVFRQAPCPVLTVGPHSPAEQNLKEELFTRILLATDFSPESMAAAPYAISLAQEYQAYLTLLHVIEQPTPGDLVRPFELVASCERLLRDLVPSAAELWCIPHCIVEQGLAAEKILEVGTKQAADLVVLGVRQPRGVPGAGTHLPISTAHKVVSHAACPVLTVRG